MVEIKHNDFIDAVPVIALNKDNDLRMYGEGRTQIPLSLHAMIGPLGKIQDRQGLY